MLLAISDGLVEFRLIGRTWVSEDGAPATFKFPLAVFKAMAKRRRAESGVPIHARQKSPGKGKEGRSQESGAASGGAGLRRI